jgi:thiol-disulfide isomerase/thioredoxin
MLVAVCGLPGIAHAQDAEAPKVASSISPEKSAKAKATLERAAKAIAELKSISYTIKTESNVNTTQRPVATGFRVTLSRGDGGVWRAMVKSQDLEDTNKLTPAHVAFDGKTARAADAVNRVIHEGTFGSLDEAQTFLSKFRVRPAVLWDVFGKEPLKTAMEATRMTVEESVEVNGQMCDVVRVEAGGGDRKPTMDEGNLPGYRFYFSAEDHLLRKIERFKASRLADDFDDYDKPNRIITLTNIEVDKPVADDAFTIATPEGYSVKGADGVVRAATSGDNNSDTSKAKEAGDPKLLAVGTDAPDWSLKDAAGGDFTLSSQRGKVVLMDFWATWCGPCKLAMPGVQRLHEKYKDRGLVAVGLATWDKGDPKAYMDSKKFTYGLVLGADQVALEYKVTGIPTFYVIGPDGKIVFSAIGFDPSHEEHISALIEKYLPAKK